MRLQHARTGKEQGHDIVLVERNGKRPVFPAWQNIVHSIAEIDRHILQYQGNWGIKLRGLMVVDRDASDAKAWEWMRQRKVHHSRMSVKSPNGFHRYFRLADLTEDIRSKIKHLSMPFDLLTGNRFVLGPGSEVEGKTYELKGEILPPADLPLFPVEVLRVPEKPKSPSLLVSRLPPTDGKITDLQAYLRRIPSVAGQNGSKGLMRVCFVVLDQGLDMMSAIQHLEAWNAVVPIPQWSQEDLLRAYQNACRKRQQGAKT